MRNASRSADYGRVVQLVRTPACHAGGRGFEPHSGRHNIFAFTKALCFDGFQVYASVAQSVEQGTENPRVDGSIPSGGTNFLKAPVFASCGFSSSGRAPPCQGGGSEFEPRNPLFFRRYSQVVRRGTATP